ncbi:hypothetical protein VNO77_24271 [Canavalia gladiata]|uniref:Uncharacterized protein n=1 Tax=Canavalia gladiata TaxID=3824 RepID=A0AAN9L5Z4_CANGL
MNNDSPSNGECLSTHYLWQCKMRMLVKHCTVRHVNSYHTPSIGIWKLRIEKIVLGKDRYNEFGVDLMKTKVVTVGHKKMKSIDSGTRMENEAGDGS